MATLFTADLHGNDTTIALLRGFKTKEEHDSWLIHCWNQQVKRSDLVYMLGDFCKGDHKTVRSFRMKLQGKIILIAGNHDHQNRIQNLPELFTGIYDIKEIKIQGFKTTLCHYSLRTWPSSNFNSFMLHGHSHGGLLPQGKQLDVDIGSNHGILYTEDDILAIMKLRGDNFNYIDKSITP